MPPFRVRQPTLQLEPPSPRKERPEYRMLITKRTYSPNVQTGEWKNLSESRPIDADPFCPGKVNHFVSHYNRIGTDTESCYETTTQAMLKQFREKDKYSNKKEKKTLINFISYNDWLPCKIPNPVCPQGCVSDYLTTMQYSYTLPRPYVMQGLSYPAIPILQNRKLKHEDPLLSSNQYFDEGFEELSRRLAQVKSFRNKSYNPCTGKYSDGSDYPERKLGCYQLEFDSKQ